MKTSIKYQMMGESGCNRHLGVFMMILTALVVCTTARGAEIPKDTLIACALGEGEGEPLKAKVLLVEGVVNRGSTKGVYGCEAVSKRGAEWYRGRRLIGKQAAVQAKIAVETVLRDDYNNRGVTVFGCRADLPKFYRSAWFKKGNFQLVDHQGGTWFFKQTKKGAV